MSFQNKRALSENELENIWEKEPDEESLNFNSDSDSENDYEENTPSYESNRSDISENPGNQHDSDDENDNRAPNQEGVSKKKKKKLNDSETITWVQNKNYIPKNILSILKIQKILWEKLPSKQIYFTAKMYQNKPQHMIKSGLITNSEMYCFIGVSLLMPQVKKLKLVDYWSRDDLLATSIFGQVFSRDRYLSILRSLHFVDNTSDDTVKEDKLWKIRMVLSHLQTTYENKFYPFENLCID
ncbi:hypothetical protein JTB14_023153 [Gonioctena quinquepunctata]|nr:hypothetical protein JTB14_023153 [Gonioctena quinquepunctata]